MVRSFLRFILHIYLQRHLLYAMAAREVKTQYIGSFLGVVWTFIHPLVLITVFWFVFSVGFKAKPLNDIPFVVWLTAGMAPWFVFAEILSGSVSVVVHHAHLIKKTLFQPQILPVVKILSSFVAHTVFLLMLMGLILFQGMEFSLFFLQFLYYLACLAVFSLGLGWALAALNVFIRDTAQVVSVIIQVGFWATPVLWDINMMTARMQKMLKLNPVYYIVQGYRESFFTFVPFWQHPWYTLYFWGVTAVVVCCGALIFRSLKPQFADVL